MKRAAFTFLSLLCLTIGLIACNDDLLKNAAVQSNSKAIFSFEITIGSTKVTAKIDTVERIITLKLPALTSPKGLVPLIGISNKASISPASGIPQDFAKELIYTLTAENGTSHTYRVLTSVAQSSKKDIVTFKFSGVTPEAVGSIDTTTKIIYVKVPAGTDLTKLTPTILISDKATVSPASGEVQNYSKDVIYTVKAENGTTKTYTVRVGVPISINALPKTTYLPNDLMTIQGTNFLNPLTRMTVTFVDTKTGTKTVITNFTGNATNLLFAIPNSMLPGTYNVIVTTDDKQTITLKEIITINAPTNAPKVTSVSKTSLKPNDTFTITGTGFSTTIAQNSVHLVRKNGTEETLIVKSATATLLTITVPTDVKLDTFVAIRVEVVSRGSVLYTAAFTTSK